MKRICTIFCIMLAIIFATPVLAAHSSWIADNANLMTEAQCQSLTQTAQQLHNKYGMDVVILTTESTNGKDITDFADDYYDYNGYGDSGVLLVLAMDCREWAISTSGDAIDALPDYAQELLMDKVLPYFTDGSYYTGFYVFLNGLDTRFSDFQSGKTIEQEPDYALLVVISLAIGLVAAAITVAVLKSGMKTAVAQRNASGYVREGTFQISRQQDIFLYSRTSKTRRSESSSGSGSSTHRSSSGRSHGGSRGRF